MYLCNNKCTIQFGNIPKPNVIDNKLKNIIENNYRPEAKIGSGSTADALRFEKATGRLVGGKSHLLKVQENINALKNWLNKNPNALTSDIESAKLILNDLVEAQKL